MKKALIIGINYNGSSAQLNGCINDAKVVHKMLIEKLGFEDKNIIFMTEECDSNHCPTRDNILSKIREFVKDVKNGDILYFHYSGHGTQVVDTNGDEEDGYDECLVPLDYKSKGFIIDDDLRIELADKIPEGASLFGVLDCCNSGTGFDLKYIVREVIQERVESVDRDDFKTFYEYLRYVLRYGSSKKESYSTYTLNIDGNHTATKGKIMMLSGCKDDQYSLDVTQGSTVGGALTLAYIKTMEEYNYSPTCTELLSSVRQKVEKDYNSPQIPQLSLGKSSNVEKRFNPK